MFLPNQRRRATHCRSKATQLFLTTNDLDRKPVYAYVLQIIVVANHMGGKDTHVRGLRVLGPIECVICVEPFL
jgi:hypothetical protein